MPEGDTLFHLAGQLDPLLRGQIITDSDVRTRRYATAELTGSRITGVRSVGIALLDQSILAGIGNIYRCEVLFVARLAPHTPAGDRDPVLLGAVVDLARALMLANSGAGPEHASTRTGASARTRGRGRFWVYARTGAPCPRCGAVIQHDRLAGRDLYWCPACQHQ
ncbi:zinc finger domain-containing protein [Auritidibacter ignavus]|uniref:zinc finger domain-containing protein n=1 Tax=Auritidibacter ignavus TaxID=678932 RepID=UPI00244ACAB8|nr:zinc finger domain-containing protein [Auritidibacter ignavus]WGH89872.1 zinc finger domain-containing protein [Auritidibacter ignavus]